MKMNHVGIMVGDMDKAVEFYTKALGLRIVMNNTKVIEERASAIGRMCIAVFGEGFKGFNIAHLVTTDGIGVELFEMKDRQDRHEVDFSRLGIFHFCLQLPKEQFDSKRPMNTRALFYVWEKFQGRSESISGSGLANSFMHLTM